MSKRKFWIVTADHSGVPLGMHLKDEGEDVCLAMIRPEDKHGKRQAPENPEQDKEWEKKIKYLTKNAGGLLPKRWMPDAMREMSKDDYVIFDQMFGFQYGEALRRRDFKVLGGMEIGYKLERERDKTLKFLKSVGFDLPQQQKFSAGSSKVAIKFLQAIKDKELFALKSDNSLVVTTVAYESNDELIQKLEAEEKNIDTAPFILQEKVEGIEFAVETYYSKGKPILANVDIEAKRKYSEACEVQTGCSYDLLWMIPIDHPLRERVNKPLDEYASKNIGTGLLDISVIYDHKKDKMFALEMCGSRFAYNALYSMLSLLTVPVGEFFANYMDNKYRGDASDSLFRMNEYAMGLRLFNDESTPDQLISYPDEMKNDTWLWDVYRKGGKLLTTGDEAIGIVTAQGENPEGAAAELRKEWFKFSMPTAWSRDDYDEDNHPAHPLSRFHQMKKYKLI